MVTVDVMEAARDEYLRRLRHAYATDRIDADELDRLTEHVLSNGHLNRRLEPVTDPDPRSSLAANLRRGRYRRQVQQGDEDSLNVQAGRDIVVDYSERRWRL